MAAKTNFENCGDCSGLKARVNGVLVILTVLSGLLTMVLTQGNNIRSEVAKEIYRHDLEIQNIKKDVAETQRRVSILEENGARK